MLFHHLPSGRLAPAEFPRRTLGKEERWLRDHPEPWSDEVRREHGRLFTAKMERWLDADYGACHLARPDIRNIVAKSLQKFDRLRYDLDCFVLMPNHVHLVWQMRNDFLMTKELKSLKGASAKYCNDRLDRSGSFWMDKSYDRLIAMGESCSRSAIISRATLPKRPFRKVDTP